MAARSAGLPAYFSAPCSEGQKALLLAALNEPNKEFSAKDVIQEVMVNPRGVHGRSIDEIIMLHKRLAAETGWDLEQGAVGGLAVVVDTRTLSEADEFGAKCATVEILNMTETPERRMRARVPWVVAVWACLDAANGDWEDFESSTTDVFSKKRELAVSSTLRSIPVKLVTNAKKSKCPELYHSADQACNDHVERRIVRVVSNVLRCRHRPAHWKRLQFHHIGGSPFTGAVLLLDVRISGFLVIGGPPWPPIGKMSRGAPPPPKPLLLELTTTSVRNVVFSTPGDSIYYEAVTLKWIPTITTVKKLDFSTGEMVPFADIERKRGEEPRVKFSGEENFSPASEFLSSDNPFGLQGRFRAPNNKTFKWVAVHGHLELFPYNPEDDANATTKPLVAYRKHKRYFGCGLMSRRPALVVQQDVKDSLDSIIVRLDFGLQFMHPRHMRHTDGPSQRELTPTTTFRTSPIDLQERASVANKTRPYSAPSGSGTPSNMDEIDYVATPSVPYEPHNPRRLVTTPDLSAASIGTTPPSQMPAPTAGLPLPGLFDDTLGLHTEPNLEQPFPLESFDDFHDIVESCNAQSMVAMPDIPLQHSESQTPLNRPEAPDDAPQGQPAPNGRKRGPDYDDHIPSKKLTSKRQRQTKAPESVRDVPMASGSTSHGSQTSAPHRATNKKTTRGSTKKGTDAKGLEKRVPRGNNRITRPGQAYMKLRKERKPDIDRAAAAIRGLADNTPSAPAGARAGKRGAAYPARHSGIQVVRAVPLADFGLDDEFIIDTKDAKLRHDKEYHSTVASPACGMPVAGRTVDQCRRHRKSCAVWLALVAREWHWAWLLEHDLVQTEDVENKDADDTSTTGRVEQFFNAKEKSVAKREADPIEYLRLVMKDGETKELRKKLGLPEEANEEEEREAPGRSEAGPSGARGRDDAADDRNGGPASADERVADDAGL
ncbi:hypothetical protein AURDEDRAFT_122629 [Auricularia subglabra TFB-10046 SS5]|nr:hypothetical protein AURDEDRAFT_122629 [Auricularia subglabra TFB-10046 SS5]